MDTVGQVIIYFFLFTLLYFQVFLLLTFFEKNKEAKKPKLLPEKLPSVTILVPCFNEESTLDRTVASLLALDYPKHLLSIFLINDGSTDNTEQVMKRFAKGFPQIRTWSKENTGKFRTLNFGLEHTTSELVGCLDADSFVDSAALKEIVKYFHSNKEIMAVTPSIRIYEPNTLIRMIQNAEYDLGTFIRKTLSFIGAIHITPGPFSIFKREVFSIIGNYRHAHNTEDLEIALRMQKAKMKIDNAPKAIVYTVGPATPKALYKQRVRWTGGFLQNLVDYRHMLLNKEHGVLGLFILPMTVFSVISSLYIIGTGSFYFLDRLVQRFQDLSLVNFDIIWKSFDFGFNIEWFFINTDVINFVSIILIITIIVFVAIGRTLTSNENKFSHFLSFDLIFFLTLYGFIAPIWLLKSVYNTILSKEAKWR